jgi:hypothetical protein
MTTITTTIAFCNQVNNAVLDESANAGFLYGLITNDEEMSALAVAASRQSEDELQSAALWALGIMMVADSAAIRQAAYEVARDNPLAAACEVLGSDNADLAASAAYFMAGFVRHGSVEELTSMANGLRLHAGLWCDKKAVFEHLRDAMYRFGMEKPVCAPLSVALALFNAAPHESDCLYMAKAINNIAAKTSQAALTQRIEAMVFLEKAADRLRYTRHSLYAKELCWAVSNLACDGLWSDWIHESPMYRALLYMQPEHSKQENLMALANVVISASFEAQVRMRDDRLLRAVLQSYRGRPNLEIAQATALLVAHDDENSDFDYESE